MSDLARLQGEFQDHLLRGTRAIEERVAGSARVPVATRLGIYAGAYGSRLIDALRSSYPALAALLGEEDFQALGAEYVRTHDSPYFSIRDYGDALEEFLGAHARYAEVPLLAELARWEWMLCAVFDAADEHELSDDDGRLYGILRTASCVILAPGSSRWLSSRGQMRACPGMATPFGR